MTNNEISSGDIREQIEDIIQKANLAEDRMILDSKIIVNVHDGKYDSGEFKILNCSSDSTINIDFLFQGDAVYEASEQQTVISNEEKNIHYFNQTGEICYVSDIVTLSHDLDSCLIFEINL